MCGAFDRFLHLHRPTLSLHFIRKLCTIHNLHLNTVVYNLTCNPLTLYRHKIAILEAA